MDLRDKFKDVQIQEILVQAVLEDMMDNHGDQASSLRAKIQELLGRARPAIAPTLRSGVTTPCCMETDRAPGLVTNGLMLPAAWSGFMALHFLSKAHRCEVQARGWEKKSGTFKEVIKRAIDLANVTLGCSKKKSNPQESLQMLFSIHLATKAKPLHADVATGEIHGDLSDDVKELEQLITELRRESA
nr:tetratricopeptide repeat protein 27-like [Oncorhynchus nerka]XP_029496562.1 tetratricopeptide repeat protein 27-like [Oncorhynchus nerka]